MNGSRFLSTAQIYRAVSGFIRSVFTDVYVSRYWTKVAATVLDATRSDLSASADFSVRERETARRAIFLRLQLDNVKLCTAIPFRSSRFPVTCLSLCFRPLSSFLLYPLVPCCSSLLSGKYMNSIRLHGPPMADPSGWYIRDG